MERSIEMAYDKLLLTRMAELTPVHRQFGDHDEFDNFAVIAKTDHHHCSVAFYRLPPGKANFPYHYHECNEEVFYIVSGRGVVLTEEGEQPIAAGDVIFCPATPGGAHKIANTSADEPLIYLEFDTINDPDIAHYPKTGAFGIIRRDSARSEFFPREPTLNYARDVETPEKDW